MATNETNKEDVLDALKEEVEALRSKQNKPSIAQVSMPGNYLAGVCTLVTWNNLPSRMSALT